MKKLILSIAFIYLSGFAFAQNLDVIGDINTKGKVKINGNSGTTGQVLMSNGANPPAWTTVSSSTCAVGGKFSFRYENVTSQTVASNVDNLFNVAAGAPTSQSAFVSFASGLDYNTNSDVSVDLNTGLFTFNRAGLYHFEGCLRMFLSTPVTQNQHAGLGSNVSLLINGTTTPHVANQIVLEPNGPVNANFNQYGGSIPFFFDRYFTAGGTLRLKMNIFNITNTQALSVLGLSAGGYVSGHFVSE